MNAPASDFDCIEIPAAELPCRIGVAPGESDQPQTLRLGLRLYLDLAPAGRSAELDDTVDYAALLDRIEGLLAEGVHALLEEVAEAIAARVLEDPRVRAVEVRVEKLSPPWPARRGSVAVRIHRGELR